MYRALILNAADDGTVQASVTTITDADLPQDGDVTIAVAYSGLNYKDGLVMKGLGKLVRTYPHVPGVDLVGEVVASSDSRYSVGDMVISTGWRVGEAWWGGYAERARLKADWLVPLPDGLTPRDAMAVGTAGLTAALSIMALESRGITPDSGTILVTGAAGGVGSQATAMLAAKGYSVAAVTGRPEMEDYLRGLGASSIVPRSDLAELSPKPMESGQWAGCIDNVGGAMLARIIGQMAYGGVIAAVGNAGGIGISTNVLPFILRGVSLLGIDSVMQPYSNRLLAWSNVCDWMPKDLLSSMVVEAGLDEMLDYADLIIGGGVKGRVIVNPSA